MRKILKPNPIVRETRIREKFLFFPKVINRELRWLEKAAWVEQYVHTGYDEPSCHWEAINWKEV